MSIRGDARAAIFVSQATDLAVQTRRLFTSSWSAGEPVKIRA
jgi:hypothetical protein